MQKGSQSRYRRHLVIGPLLLAAFAVGLWAHPLGKFSVSHFARLTVGSDNLQVRYVVDMAEISTFQELERIDTDGDHSFSKTEYDAYAERAGKQLADNLTITVDGLRVPLQVRERKVAVPRGDGGLPILRIECDFSGDFPRSGPGSARHLRLEDTNRHDRSGWRELVVRPEAGITVFDSTAFGNGLTDELKAYPQEELAAPLNERVAQLSFIRGEIPSGATPLRMRDGRPTGMKQRDRLTELIGVRELTWQAGLLGVLIAVLLGGLHALSPGHGKAVVGAYLVGSRGTPKHAAFLGLTVTVTHTAGVFALGLVTLVGSHYFVPEKLFPILSLVSGATVVAIGLQQAASRWRKASSSGKNRVVDSQPGGDAPDSADEAHTHSRPHPRNSVTHSHGGRLHSHLPPAQTTWRNLLALGISGGLLPCPSALVVLLAAISLHRVGYGLLLVFAFSLGLAAVLTGVGVAFIYARRIMERSLFAGASRLVGMMPVCSALVITVVGVVICFGALAQAGISMEAVAAATLR